MKMNEVSRELKKQQWMETIKQCRSSGIPVKRWCKQNHVCEQTYYYWLKRIRTEIYETAVQEPSCSLVPLQIEEQNKSSENHHTAGAVLIKGDVRIELSNTISKELLTIILSSL